VDQAPEELRGGRFQGRTTSADFDASMTDLMKRFFCFILFCSCHGRADAGFR